MRYKEVEDGHIVPAGYLRGFAEGSMIVRHAVSLKHEKERRERKRSVKVVGTRKRPYSRTRPDGSRIDDVEDSISKLENQVGVVRKAHHRFPFCKDDRSVLAQFAGAQQVRGPKWARAYNGLVDAARVDAERSGMSEADAEHDARILGGDTQRLIAMLERETTARFGRHDEQLDQIFKTLRQLISPPARPKRPVGFRPPEGDR